MIPLATSADVNGASTADPVVVQSLLRRASAIVVAYSGTDWIVDDALAVPDTIPDVVGGMVERALRNPAGVTQESAGPFQRSFGTDAAKGLYLTDAEKLVVRQAVGATGLSVLSLSRGPVEMPGPTSGVDDDIAEIAQ